MVPALRFVLTLKRGYRHTTWITGVMMSALTLTAVVIPHFFLAGAATTASSPSPSSSPSSFTVTAFYWLQCLLQWSLFNLSLRALVLLLSSYGESVVDGGEESESSTPDAAQKTKDPSMGTVAVDPPLTPAGGDGIHGVVAKFFEAPSPAAPPHPYHRGRTVLYVTLRTAVVVLTVGALLPFVDHVEQTLKDGYLEAQQHTTMPEKRDDAARIAESHEAAAAECGKEGEEHYLALASAYPLGHDDTYDDDEDKDGGGADVGKNEEAPKHDETVPAKTVTVPSKALLPSAVANEDPHRPLPAPTVVPLRYYIASRGTAALRALTLSAVVVECLNGAALLLMTVFTWH